MRRHTSRASARCGRRTGAERGDQIALAPLAPLEGAPDLVERVPGFLQRLDPEQLVEMVRSVVVAAPDAERRREESLLDVVAHRAPRDAAEIRQVTDGVAGFLGHVPSYTTVTVALSTVALWTGFEG